MISAMKYFIKAFCLFAVLCFISPQIVFANSGPTFWQGYPSSEILTVDENCPVEVKREKLLFDLSGDTSHDFTINGQVRASYEMVNPLNKDISIQMAFPFVSSIANFSSDDIAITTDGIMQPYDLYIGDIVNSHGSISQQERETTLVFENILNSISKTSYQANHFSEYEKGHLYTLDVKPTTDQEINFTVDFKFDKEKTKVLTNGFNRYERNDQNARIAAWCYKPEALEIFVLGDDIDFKVKAYTDGELKQETELFKYEITEKDTELKSYLMDSLEKLTGKTEEQSESEDLKSFYLDRGQFYNLYGAALDRSFTINEGYSSCYDLIEQNYYERVLTLVYTTKFPANSRRDVTVSYKASGTMDKTKTPKPVYTFNYILNPAKNWKSFGVLDIEINTPKEAPYIVESSIKFTKTADRQYTATLNSLPPNDLSFSIYAEEKITLIDKAYGSFKNSFGYFVPIALIGIVIMAAAAVGGRVYGRCLNKKSS